MRPPMKDKVVIYLPIVDGRGMCLEDDYGKLQYKEVESIARVIMKSGIVRRGNGDYKQFSLEVILPTDTNIGEHSRIAYIDDMGNRYEGDVVEITQQRNLAGNKIYFRSVKIG